MEEYNIEAIPSEASLREVVEAKISNREDKEDPFFVCNVADIIRKYQKWVQNLPRVKPYYAVKCNPDTVILKLLSALGCGFDCASKGEISKVLDLGVPPSRLIYANPCKQASHIKFATNNHVDLMTFDNEFELKKIKQINPLARLVLRIRADDCKAVCQLGLKFGCDPRKAAHLLQCAKDLELECVGLSFHVGSGCLNAAAYGEAIETAYGVFQVAAGLGFNFTMLDIGGGFPGTPDAKIKFEDISSVLNEALDKYFPEDSNVEIIAEPGRFMVASAFTLGVSVISKRPVTEENEKGIRYMYYINDGVYGSFNCVMFDHAILTPPFLIKDGEDQEIHGCSLWGPTCDGLDCVMDNCKLPELEVGDWLFFPNMGAYTMAAASTFNGMARPRNYYIAHKPFWDIIQCALHSGVHRKAEVINSLALLEAPVRMGSGIGDDDVMTTIDHELYEVPCSIPIEAGY